MKLILPNRLVKTFKCDLQYTLHTKTYQFESCEPDQELNDFANRNNIEAMVNAFNEGNTYNFRFHFLYVLN